MALPVEPQGQGVGPRLSAARERLDAKDLPAALALYEEILASAGDRADVLVTISGDLGETGHVAEIIELIAPRYDAKIHGPATGINLVQAYLAAGEADAARHVLDILFGLGRPELAERLMGFSNAVAELLTGAALEGLPQAAAAPPAKPGLAIITISRPIWSYGLEAIGELLPPKDVVKRRIAFAQLSLPGAYPDVGAAMRGPEDELGRLSRAIPAWFAETFYFSPAYLPVAAVGCMHDGAGGKLPAILPADWTPDNMRKLIESAGGLDYLFTGSLVRSGEETVLTLKVWQAKNLKERKHLTARWTPATADAELAKVHEYLRAFMEWSPYPEGSGVPYSPPASPSAWLEATGALLSLFLTEKGFLPKEQIAPLSPVFDALAPHAFSPPASSLAWLSLRSRAASLGLAPSLSEVLLSRHPAVLKARAQLGL